MNILMLTAYPPVLNVHGGGVRMFHNIRLLAERHDVRVISFVENQEDCERLRALDMCESVTAVLRKPLQWAERSSRYPWEVQEFGTPEMQAAIEKAFHDEPVDVLQCEYFQMAQFWRPDVFTLLTQIEVQSAVAYDSWCNETHPLRKLKRYFEWRAFLRYDKEAVNRFDRVITMTEKDAAFLKSHAPSADIQAIPIGIDLTEYQPRQEQPNETLQILLFGNFRHTPNAEAARFISEKVAPQLPDLRFSIVGPNLSPIGAPANVSFRGYVDDIQALYRRPNTIIATPLFLGNGQRVKVLEAFAMGCPVVTTHRGAEGFPARDGIECLLASTAQEFAGGIRRLADSVELRRSLGNAARRMIENEFSWNTIGAKLLGVVGAAPTNQSQSNAGNSGWKAAGTRFWGIPNPESPVPALAISRPRIAGVRQGEHRAFIEDSAKPGEPVGFLAGFTNVAPAAALSIRAQIEFHEESPILHLQRAHWLNETSDSVQLAFGETKELVLAVSPQPGSLAIPEYNPAANGNRPLARAIGENRQSVYARVILNIRSRTYPDGTGYTKYFDFELFRDGLGWLHRAVDAATK